MENLQDAPKLPSGLDSFLFEHSPVGICIIEEDRFGMVNSRFEQLFDRKKEKLIGSAIARLFADKIHQQKIKQFKSFSIRPGKDALHKDIEIVIHPTKFITDQGKEKTVLFADWIVSPERQAQDPEIEDLLTAFNLSPSLVLLLDQRTNILNINDTALQIVHQTKDESIGLQPGNVLRCIRSYDTEKGCGFGPMCKKCLIRQTVQDTLKTGTNHIRVESPFAFRQNDTIYELTVLLSSIAFENKGKRNVLVCIDDITKQKDLELELRSSREQLQQKNNELKSLNTKLLDSYNKIKHINKELSISMARAEESDQLKSAFLANLSHEIRTPLNGMLGFADLITSLEAAAPEGKKYAEIINKNADQLLHIMNDVLDISMIETHQIRLNPEVVDLNRLMQSVCDDYQALAAEKQLKFRLNPALPEKTTLIFADRIRVRQILDKLVSNAFKFTHSGHIEIGYRKTDNIAEFQVSDTGEGIGTNLHRKIFDRFHQADNSETKSYGGLGLGLPIARALVNLHGGKIWLESIPGKGSSFFFTLPVDSQKSIREEPVEV